jgi:TRAP-type C4-dicarboxylate transport system permease small subunit
MEVPMPELVRLYIRSVALGFAIAALFTAGLVWWDVAGIGHLILGSDIGIVAAMMMVVFNGIVFSAVQFAFRIMAMAEDDAPRGGTGLREGVLIPIPVEARARPRATQRR